MAVIIGIETSCDETAAAVVVDGHDVRSNVVSSQIELHEKFGGVVPEIAARAHLDQLDLIIQSALAEADISLKDIDAVAVSNRPGLIGCLLIGVTAAKTLAWVADRPLVAVNHVHAHVTSPLIDLDHAPWPAVSLVVSGGHTSLYYLRNATDIALMGATTDDAAGEAFDKVSSILKLGYPGGPAVQRVAGNGRRDAVAFPRTMLGRDSLDFSFSGIKTSVLYHVHGVGKTTGGLEGRSATDIANIAASFEEAVVDVLVAKSIAAVERTGAGCLLAGGGVVANARLRERLSDACASQNVALHLAPMAYCTDNAAMIAAHADALLEAGHIDDLRVDASSTESNERQYT
jgi:N6-L-threonylcarbamoyladenine synthase